MNTPVYKAVASDFNDVRTAATFIARAEALSDVLKVVDEIKSPTLQVKRLRATLVALINDGKL